MTRFDFDNTETAAELAADSAHPISRCDGCSIELWPSDDIRTAFVGIDESDFCAECFDRIEDDNGHRLAHCSLVHTSLVVHTVEPEGYPSHRDALRALVSHVVEAGGDVQPMPRGFAGERERTVYRSEIDGQHYYTMIGVGQEPA